MFLVVSVVVVVVMVVVATIAFRIGFCFGNPFFLFCDGSFVACYGTSDFLECPGEFDILCKCAVYKGLKPPS